MLAASGRRAIRLPIHRQASYSPLRSCTAAASLSLLSTMQSALHTRSRGRHSSYNCVDEQRRLLHSSGGKSSTSSPTSISELPASSEPASSTSTPSFPMRPASAPLSVLPLSMILRSLATTTISSSPILLPPSLRVMTLLAHSTNPLLNPDRNPVLRFFLKKTFYAQFCAGENALEVRRTVARLKHIGFTGVILGYAREVVLSADQTKTRDDDDIDAACRETKEDIAHGIKPWTEGTLETVRLTDRGDFMSLKFTGAGRPALLQLQHRLPPSPHLHEAIDSICQLAHQRGVRLLFDAEQDALQDGIDDWTMRFARKYNTSPDSATIYGTYQAYKKITPTVLSRHLAQAQMEGFTLGVKLVRGAYLGSDPRECFHDTKEQTDACYDEIAASVLTRQWSRSVTGIGNYPNAHLVLATHNAESVRRARAIFEAGGAKSDVACAQLQGMADEVSCELVEASRPSAAETTTVADKVNANPTLPVYKYLVWGTTGECMKYLLRRAHENKDAVQRTRDGRDAMWAEVVRRCRKAVGLT